MLEKKHLSIRSNLLLLCLLFLTSSCSLFEKKECVLKRAAFDIGSGSTKMTIAKVDRCSGNIEEIIFEDQASVSYKQSLYNNDNSFSKSVIEKGIKELNELKTTAEDLGATEFSALATEAFRTAKNGSQTIERLENHLKQLSESIIESPEKSINQLDYLSKKEEQQLLVDFNDTKFAYPKDKTIVHLFEEQVAKTPDNVALTCKGQSLSYRKLNEKSNQLARHIRSEYQSRIGRKRKNCRDGIMDL